MNKPEREGFIAVEEVEEEKPKTIEATATEEVGAVEESLPEWPITVKLLHKPVQIKAGETTDELTFREPTAGDIMRAGGNPCRIEVVELGGGNVTWQPIIDDIKMLRLMATLSGILEPFLQRMDTRDYASCAHRLRRFFLPEQGIW